MSNPVLSVSDQNFLLKDIHQWALDLGFSQVGVSNIDLSQAETKLQQWLDQGFYADMTYMRKHGVKRSQPDELIPGTASILSLRMDYLPETQDKANKILHSPNLAYVSRYALGRDYHKLIRQRLQKLAKKIQTQLPTCQFRVFTDSAPVLEKPIAYKAGLGWVGKHSNILNRQAGSWFFLGEIYLNFLLPYTILQADHCGDCIQCIAACPTKAIVAPYIVDARKCISYLTIENHGEIPIEFRSLIGNRIYGCDDCQLVCPWNRYAKISKEKDFSARQGLNDKPLTELFLWNENDFLHRLEGSPIRRIGYQNWLRNIAIGLGNAEKNKPNLQALLTRKDHPEPLVKEHIQWAIIEQQNELR